jgi:hypothetical protein
MWVRGDADLRLLYGDLPYLEKVAPRAGPHLRRALPFKRSLKSGVGAYRAEAVIPPVLSDHGHRALLVTPPVRADIDHTIHVPVPRRKQDYAK